MKKERKEKKDRISLVKETTTIDKSTGEIIEHKAETVRSGKREPDYVKVYLKDLLYVLNVPGVKTDIVLALCRLLTYDNQIILNKAIKMDVAKGLNIKLNTLEQSVSKLVREGILIRKATGLYYANPFYIARGDWSDIAELRMLIKYSSEGKKVEIDWDRKDSKQLNMEL